MENQAQDKNDNQSSDTEVEPSKLHPSGATVVAAVFDIVTAATRCPPHLGCPLISPEVSDLFDANI